MRVFLIAALLALNSCHAFTSPRTSTGVSMQLDASCGTLSPQTFALSVDGKVAGTAKLGAGQTSDPWPITPGSHTLSAEVPTLNLFLSWQPLTVDVPVSGVIYLMRCR